MPADGMAELHSRDHHRGDHRACRRARPAAGRVERAVIVDAHVHFWDPGTLHYPWLDEIPALERAFLPADYRAAAGNVAVSKLLFVEANCRPDEALREVAMIERLAETEPTIAGIVAFAEVAEGLGAG